MTKKEEKKMCEERILSYKYLHPCKICGNRDVVVLEFHHIRRDEKAVKISKMPGKCPWSDIIREIRKCEVLCANCHRRLTASEDEYYSKLLDEVQNKFQRANISDKIITPNGLISLKEHYKKLGWDGESVSIFDYYKIQPLTADKFARRFEPWRRIDL